MITINLFTSGTHTQSVIENLKEAENLKLVNIYQKLPAKIEPADLFIVADFGQIIPKKIIEMPKYGTLCLHPSLLPFYRGASPVPQAIIDGQKETSLTIFQVDEKVDHGPIIVQIKEKIHPDHTAGELCRHLFKIGAEVLPGIIDQYVNWCRGAVTATDRRDEVSSPEKTSDDKIKFFLPPKPQNHQQATYTKRLTKEDGRINWHWPPKKIERFIRAMTPWPGAWSEIATAKSTSEASAVSSAEPVEESRRNVGRNTSEVENEKRLKILKAHLEKKLPDRSHLTIPDRQLVIDLVQLPGKNPISFQAFLAGHPNWQLI